MQASSARVEAARRRVKVVTQAEAASRACAIRRGEAEDFICPTRWWVRAWWACGAI